MERAERLSLTLALAAAAALAVAAALLVAEHGVDVFVSDQWMTYGPFFREEGLLRAFALQHGPHRQGAGAAVMWLGLHLADWDARADSIAIIAITFLSCLAALVLKRTLFGRVDLGDLAIPAIVMNLVQLEAVVLVPNPAHGALPVLLLLSICIAWAATSAWTRAVALSLLAPLLLFTGFGMVAAPILLALLARDAWFAQRSDGIRASAPRLVPFAALTCALPLFLAGYRVEPGASVPLAELLRFAALMPARFASIELGRFGGLAVVAGALILAALAMVAIRSAGTLLHSASDARARTIFLLCSYSILFIVLAALGRASQGAQFGQSSRYMPLLVPGMLGLYYAARAAERRAVRVGLTLLVAGLALGAILPPSLQHDQSTQVFSLARREWRDCYLATHDAQRCAERARMQVWVGPYDAKVQAQLDYLERNRLSLFRPQD